MIISADDGALARTWNLVVSFKPRLHGRFLARNFFQTTTNCGFLKFIDLSSKNRKQVVHIVLKHSFAKQIEIPDDLRETVRN